MELHKGRSGASGPDREGSTPTWGAGGPRSGGGGGEAGGSEPRRGSPPPPPADSAVGRSPPRGQTRSLRLGRSQGSCCVSACRRGWGRRGSGREHPLPPTSSDRQGQGQIQQETLTARQTDAPTLRHTDTHRPGKQPPSVRLGTHQQQLDTHIRQQPAREQRPRERRAATLLCLQRHTSVEASRRTEVGESAWGGGRLGEGAAVQHTRHPHAYSSFLIVQGPTPFPRPKRYFRNFGKWGRLDSL